LILSVIIPTFNRWYLLKRTLDSLASQSFPAHLFEIIVVDDGSTNDTRSGQKHYPQVTFTRQSNRGPAAARNTGATIARGDILVFTDDDCTVPSQWLHRIESLFTTTNCDLLGGATRNAGMDYYWSTVHQSIINFWQRTLNRGKNIDAFLTSNNMAIRKSVFSVIGGFDEQYDLPGGEDRDLAIRAAAAGLRVHFEADLIIDHHHEMTFGTFCQQHAKYGRGSFLLRTSHPSARTAWPLYFKLLGHGWNGPSIPARMKNFIAVLLSQSCITWGFFAGVVKKL